MKSTPGLKIYVYFYSENQEREIGEKVEKLVQDLKEAEQKLQLQEKKHRKADLVRQQ